MLLATHAISAEPNNAVDSDALPIKSIEAEPKYTAPEEFDFSPQKKRTVVVKVNEPYIDIHTGPSKSYPIHYIAQRNEALTLLKRRTDWFKVKTQNGKKGWVHLDGVAMTVTDHKGTLAKDNAQLNYVFNKKRSLGMSVGRFAGADLLNISLSQDLTNNLSLELHGAEYFGLSQEGYIGSLQLVHKLFPKWPVSPFLSLGGGAVRQNFKRSLVALDDRTDKFAQISAGVSVPLNPRYGLRLEYKHLNVLPSRDDNEELEAWQLGLIAYF